MFLAHVAHLRYDRHYKKYFDGKVGLQPFTEVKLARLSSGIRSKRTPITIPSTVDKGDYRQLLVEKLLPTITNKFPCGYGRISDLQPDKHDLT